MRIVIKISHVIDLTGLSNLSGQNITLDNLIMHELAVTQSLLKLALKHAERVEAKKITRLNLVIGQMSSIVDDSIQFYWDTMAQDTIAASAKLHFKRVPATFYCFNCCQKFELSQQTDFTCPHCQSGQVQVVGGDEFRLESIDIDEHL